MAGNTKTITQRIALVGGQEIEVQFKALGEAGAAAIKRIDTAAQSANFGAKISAAITDLQQRFGRVRTSFGEAEDALNKFQSSARGVATRIGIVTAAVGGLAAGFLKLAESVGQSVEAQENAAAAAGLSFEAYSKLQGAFQIAGIDGDKFGVLMNKLNKAVGEAKDKAKDFAKAQQKLSEDFAKGKISAEQYSEKFLDLTKNAQESNEIMNKLHLTASNLTDDPRKNLEIFIEALGRLPRGAERSRLELELLGRSGSKVDAIVEKGAKGLRDLEAAAVKARPPLSEIARTIITDMDDAFDQLKLRLQSIKENFVLAFGTSVTDLLEAINNAIDNNRTKIQQFAFFLNAIFEQVSQDIIKLLNGEEIDPNGLVGRFETAFNNIATAATITFDIVKAVFVGISKTLEPVAQLINSLFGTNLNGQILAIIVSLTLFSGILGTILTAVGALITVFTALGTALAAIFGPEAAVIIGLVALGFFLTNIATELVPGLQKAFDDFFKFFEPGITFITNLVKDFLGWIEKAIKAAASLFGFNQGGQVGNDQEGAGFAGGGAVRGPGSGTSDSIVARLSNGEFVQRAKAVAYYGPGFMNALNKMAIPRHVLSGLAGFADGGMVRAMGDLVPRFASGGLVGDLGPAGGGSKGNLTLVLDGQTFNGISAEDSTFQRLQKYAVRRNVQSAGRKPLWVS